MTRAVVAGIGHAVPPKIVTNDDLSKLVDTNDAWIVQRTGIKERRVCAADETSSTLSIEAANEALQDAGWDPDSLDLVIVGTVTGDNIFPATSCMVQDAIGARNAGAFDLGAACAGFIYGTAVAASMIESGQCKRILVVGVDVLSKYVDWTDRSTCVLFGDGAGAVVLEGREGTDRGVLETVLLSDGSGARHIILEAGGSRYPITGEEWKSKNRHLYMAGAEVYRFAVNNMGDACLRALAEIGMTSDEIDLFVPHQANLRIIDSAADKLGLPPEKVFKNVEKYGNTSGGSIPLALYEAVKDGRLREGMVVMTVGFGAGLVWGANIIRW
ncbi:MAG: ketoacyl-ACP synthase III [Methanoregulaceae archaeon]|nr:ketoacyl-ACP synthase III [Methanoregulaceae archaeon]